MRFPGLCFLITPRLPIAADSGRLDELRHKPRHKVELTSPHSSALFTPRATDPLLCLAWYRMRNCLEYLPRRSGLAATTTAARTVFQQRTAASRLLKPRAITTGAAPVGTSGSAGYPPCNSLGASSGRARSRFAAQGFRPLRFVEVGGRSCLAGLGCCAHTGSGALGRTPTRGFRG